MSEGHLLVIEDDPPSRSMLVRGLQRLGYAAEGASDALEAQARIRVVGSASFDAVLVDLRMPRMDGLQFVSWLEQLDPTLGAILLSAQEEAAMNDQLDHPSLLFRLHKPVPFPELDKTVQKAVAFTRVQRHHTPAGAV